MREDSVMRKRMLRQAGGCLLVALALLISGNSNIGILERGYAAVMTYMQVNYTAEDIKNGVQSSARAVSALTGKAQDAVSVMTGKRTYGEPVDEDERGSEKTVYAAGSGRVTETGENRKLGKYVKIKHGSDGESVYGNLKSVYIHAPSRVRKGQIIGVYKKEEGREFYYSFREFN